MIRGRSWLAIMPGLTLLCSMLGCEAETSPPSQGPCDEYCHWDCLARQSFFCFGGEVWRVGYGPRPCCHYGDPWPGPGPMCTTGSAPAFTCPSGRCAVPANVMNSDPEAWCAPVDGGVDAEADATMEADVSVGD